MSDLPTDPVDQSAGNVTVRTSFTQIDGTWVSYEISLPLDASQGQLVAAADQAETMQTYIRERFHPFCTTIEPHNYLCTFPKHQGRRFGDIVYDDPEYLRWIAYTATGASPAMKAAAHAVLENPSPAGQEASYTDGNMPL